uniref:hypothetical protein n=1 Tax=Parolsenella massiliensis TaxID=1871022 RepID=UPI000933B99F|nr:hypothetical protein [Parolsenella massiliensis]
MTDERREVAERLRAYDVTGFKESAIVPFLEILGVGYMNWRGIMRRLAKLIDPTCEIIRPISPGKFGVCSACGALVNMRDSVANATNYIKPLYCPNCGARVVRGDGE